MSGSPCQNGPSWNSDLTKFALSCVAVVVLTGIVFGGLRALGVQPKRIDPYACDRDYLLTSASACHDGYKLEIVDRVPVCRCLKIPK
jgi:hypothetical protein